MATAPDDNSCLRVPACVAGVLSLAWLLLVLVPFALLEPFTQSERMTQLHALLWLAFFWPLSVFPAAGHWMDQVLPLASDDPRIALIPQFLLMFLLWGALFFGAGVAVARLRRNKGRPSPQADR